MAAALAAACLLGGTAFAAPAGISPAGHAAADRAGATAGVAGVRFAVGSPAMIAAEAIAARHWGARPCAGVVSVSWGPINSSINASSNWWNPTSVYGNAAANSRCTITFNQHRSFSWPMFCSVMVHEMGHLSGQQHSTDRGSVMYPVYEAPTAGCRGAATAAIAAQRRAGPPPRG